MATRRTRHRSGIPCEAAASSSSDDEDEEDAFSALTRKDRKNKKAKVESENENEPAAVLAAAGGDAGAVTAAAAAAAAAADPQQQAKLPVSTTSSNKRHHGVISDTRRAKMDALLVELEAEKRRAKTSSSFDGTKPNKPGGGFVPDKRGSFVEPGQEHLTTNVFVGNLAPNITEEELTELFRQFGDLYSVKIMWPRTPEERARNRHSGFVCFGSRQDAEDAIAACDETDPFNCGRRIMMRWGKNVRGTNVSTTSMIIRKKKTHGEGPPANAAPSDAVKSLSDAERGTAIQVVVPKDAQKINFISTVASFVAKDGALLEQSLLQRETGNPKFDFIGWQPPPRDNTDHIYYRWRVYSFCQGDGFHTWRTEPFVMVQGGRIWIPPPLLDTEAARREHEAEMAKEESILRQKQERRVRNAGRDYMTGRQLEQKKGGPDGGAKLEPADLDELDRLTRRQLCASRDSICEAMAFCFEKSGAAKQISSILEELLVESGPGVGVETRIARLYLVSDILFNSQQPGVRNAFRYRDAIERMAPKVFESLGKHGNGQLGRMTMNKIVSAVRTVLTAWTDWNVFNQVFLDELFARFEGREIPEINNAENSEAKGNDEASASDKEESDTPEETAAQPVREVAQGKWTTVSKDDEGHPGAEADKSAAAGGEVLAATTGGERAADVDGEPLGGDDDDADGEPLEEEEEEDADGEPLEEGEDSGDGMPLDEGEDAYGEPIDKDEDVDGDPI